MAQIIGTNSKEYISSLNFMDQRDYLDQVLNITGEDQTMVDALELTGKTAETVVPEYIHTENVQLFKKAIITTLSAVAGRFGVAPGDPVDFTLVTTLNTFPIVGETAMFQSKKQGIVTVSNLTTGLVTVVPLGNVGADNTLGPVANGQSVIFFSGAYGEGSDDPSTRKAEWVKSSNNIQIVKTAGEITDLQKVSKVEVKYNGSYYIMYKVQQDALKALKMKIQNALMFQRRSKSGVGGALPDASGNQVWTTQGLRPSIISGDGVDKLTGGVTQQVAGSVSRTDYRTLYRALDKKQAPKEYWCYAGGDLRADTDELFSSGVGSGAFNAPAPAGGLGLQYATDFSSFGSGDAKKRAIDLGFDTIRIYGRTTHFKTVALLDHTGLFGATGFDFSYEGYFVPMDKIKVDGGSGMVDRFRMRFMDGGHGFGTYNEVVTGKLAPTPTNTKSVLHISYQAIVGAHVAGTDHFAMIHKSAL